MLRSMTHRQFIEWQVYADLEPFDEERDDIRTASIVQMLANVNRNSKKKPTPYKLDEFRLRFGDATVVQKAAKKDWRQMKELGKMMAMAHGAKVA